MACRCMGHPRQCILSLHSVRFWRKVCAGMSDSTPSESAPQHEGFAWAILFLILATLIAGGWRWAANVRQTTRDARDYHHRIIAARKVVNTLTQTQWAHVYEGVKALVARNPGRIDFAHEQWPEDIVALNPYSLDYRDDEVWINWASGINEQAVHLEVVLQQGEHDPGVFLIDGPRGEADGWYIYRLRPEKPKPKS